ncbi:MAG: c-type cytochrome [Phenylobacterium sp.]|nr:MAG: c-type cytochrome [Phenylobacterium sp.]
MRRPRIRGKAALGATAALGALGLAGLAVGQILPPLPAHPVTGVTPVGFLAAPIADTTPNAAQLQRGQYLVRAGDCVSCHMREGGDPLSGGFALKTPFGTIYSANITSDRETGIGGWTPDQFHRAMHDGIDDQGKNLYPALPYPWFRRISRADDDAMLAYLKTTPAVSYTPPPNKLPFPFNIRFLVKFWNVLFLKSTDFRADPRQSAEWNRGAYLVTGLGHCGGCHTPKNWLGADKGGQDLQSGKLDNWVAPDLTANPRTGLGGWSVEEVAEYLKTGRNARAGAGGAMADVITYSTSLLSDADRHAMAVYLKTRPAGAEPAIGAPDAHAMARGAAIYSDACASCHLENGVGQPRLFPPLGHDAVLQQADPTGLEHIILAGSRVGTSPAAPTPLTMPSFAWKLTDQQVADVSTYIRNSWGNRAAAVSSGSVRSLRKSLDLEAIRYTANSGDQN